MFVYLLQLTLVASVLSYQSPSEYTLNSIDSFAPEELPPDAGSTLIGRAVYHDAFKFAVDILNNRTCPGLAHLLPNTKLNLFAQTDRGLASTAIKQIIALGEMGENFVIGAPNTGTAIPMSIVGDVYDFAILSSFAPSSSLSDKRNFPNFSRITSSTAQQVAAVQSSLVYLQQIAGTGWTDVAILASVSDIDIDYATEFITQSSPEITILAYQQFLIEEDYFDIQVREVKESGARVIFAPILADYDLILEEADKLGLVGESYVWIVTASSVYLPPSQSVPLARGTISCLTYTPPTSELRECYSEAYRNADPAQYFGAGKEPTVQEFPPFDAVVTAAFVLHELDQMEMLDGRKIPGALWSSLIRNVTWNGLTGDISFDENGDREGKLEIVYYSPPVNDYISAAVVDPYGTKEPEFISSIVWFSNTTEFPDLDIREPFHYWSCHDAKLKYDSTGKTVVLQSPDGSNIDEIASFYHCDHFIDCQNISDESADCGTNFTILFIVMGIIVVICMIIASLLIVFVIIFGIILKYRRLRCASPFFLILLLISIIVGYSSIFAWFGKPHPVACAFQPWLLGLPAISMIVALSAKNFRLYRIFKYPMSRTKISDLELFLLWCTFMIPAVLILTLWAIISTPTSDMETENDEDHQHYVCTTGGFTGEPGGIIFFSIFVAYSAFILLIGAAVSILTRNIPSSFNESTLLTISIYNLGFLSVVMIPVILVVQSLNPFISWILRTCAILYAFTATMVIQFLPIVVGIFILDKGKNVTVFKSSLKFGTNQNSSPKSNESSGSPSPLHTQ